MSINSKSILFALIAILLCSTAVALRLSPVGRIVLKQQRLHRTPTWLFSSKNDDDERTVKQTESDPTKSGISSSMREKLLRENASLGGSANEKSINPILIVAGLVAVLAVASSIIGAI